MMLDLYNGPIMALRTYVIWPNPKIVGCPE